MTFITWLGSKKRLLRHINNIVEKYLVDNSCDSVYVEPFLGSGIVLINILEKYPTRFKKYICSDVNEVLIKTFNLMKTSREKLINTVEHRQNHYLK